MALGNFSVEPAASEINMPMNNAMIDREIPTRVRKDKTVISLVENRKPESHRCVKIMCLNI